MKYVPFMTDINAFKPVAHDHEKVILKVLYIYKNQYQNMVP